MKVKVYLNEWFMNAGILGFMNIMEKFNPDAIKKSENYIETETEALRNFHKYYFRVFFRYI